MSSSKLSSPSLPAFYFERIVSGHIPGTTLLIESDSQVCRYFCLPALFSTKLSSLHTAPNNLPHKVVLVANTQCEYERTMSFLRQRSSPNVFDNITVLLVPLDAYKRESCFFAEASKLCAPFVAQKGAPHCHTYRILSCLFYIFLSKIARSRFYFRIHALPRSSETCLKS